MKHLNYAIIDQCLVSGSNFIVAVLLARYLSQEEFGLYVFSFTTLIFSIGFANNAIFATMSIIGAAADEERWKVVLNTSLTGLAIAVILLVSLYIGCGTVLNVYGKTNNGNALFVTAYILLFYMGQEFFRKAFLSRLESSKALVLDLVTYGPRIVLVYLLCKHFSSLSNAESAIYIIGITSCFGSIVGFIWSSSYKILRHTRIQPTILKKMINTGKWMVAEWVPFVVAGNLYIYAVAFMMGNTYNGVLGVCRNLVQPITILLLSIVNVALPFYSRSYAKYGSEKTAKDIAKYFGLLSVPILFYLILINAFSSDILTAIFGKSYSGHTREVLIFSVANLLIFLNKPVEVYVKASLQPKIVFKARVLSAFVSVCTVFPFINMFGLSGALYSYVLNEATMLLCTYYYLCKSNGLKSEKKRLHFGEKTIG